uniref:Minor capsid protein P11 C-terminal conserved region domain-containing protein n=1 Tax=viral metagenome TaxID=1070528 RepID=A0A6C0H9F3_9ZZZZ
MANTTNNNTMLLVLLVVVGFIIYYICNSSVDPMKPVSTSINNTSTRIIDTNDTFINDNNNNDTIDLIDVPKVLKNISEDLLSNNDNPLYNISGNTDGSNGASLTDAFAPPLDNCKCPDEFDFNKNNIDKYNIKDYLPDVNNVNKEWFDTDFAQARHELDDGTLINPDRYVIGINTVGQSLKNASYDIRGTVPNPKYSISPWNNSTIEPDYNIKSLA